jgi:hypothetical protein
MRKRSPAASPDENFQELFWRTSDLPYMSERAIGKEPRYCYMGHKRAPGPPVMVAKKRAEAPLGTLALGCHRGSRSGQEKRAGPQTHSVRRLRPGPENGYW